MVNNAKTLTRKGGANPYGQRLIERGHILRFKADDKAMPFFILNTSIESSIAEAPNI